MKHRLYILLMLPIILLSCDEEGRRAAWDAFPFGLWVSRSGFTIEIKRDMTYEICLEGECNQGVVLAKSPGPIDYGSPILADMYDLPLGRKLLLESRDYEMTTMWGRNSWESDEKLMTMARSPAFYGNIRGGFRNVCHGRPCQSFGPADTHRRYFFHLRDPG